jgi:predicted outer membrane repeat protein
LLRVDANATIRRIHFKNGLATNNGGAIYKGNVSLTLESCVFSGNRSVSRGGAVYSDRGTLIIRGCTFYGNTAGIYGGVIYYSQAGVTLTGNLFYGNTAINNPVVMNGGGSGYWPGGSYNVADVSIGREGTESGWSVGTGDMTSTGPVVSGKTFKLLSGSDAAARLPGTLPEDYPTTDFYGQSISGGGAAGAVQAAVSGGGYYLELSVNNPLAGGVSASFTPDPDGLVAGGSATLTASSGTAPYSFAYWLQDGVRIATNSSCTVNISAHTRIQGVYSIDVTTFAGAGSDTTPGTLRYALANAQNDDVIRFSGVSPGTTVLELEGPLPEITKNLTIEGEGVTLTRAASWTGSGDSLLRIGTYSDSPVVTVRRIHFKDGVATNYGGAIYSSGTLTLESCIFSGNRVIRTDAYGFGGAVEFSTSGGLLTIRGCTFYGNTARNGGAISMGSGNMTMTGNLLYGNISAESGVVSAGNTPIYSYNVVDAPFGIGTGKSGWNAGTGDIYSTTWPVSLKTFKVLYGEPAATNLPSVLPSGYPTTDFYGQPISGGGAAGAVQAVTAAGGYYLGLSVNNSSAGTVSVNSQPDGDDLYSGGSVITATPNTGWGLWYWLVDGVKTIAPSLTLSAHTRIQAVFCRSVTVFTDGAGSETTPETLRYALTNAGSGDTIVFSGVTPGDTTITLDSPLPQITESVVIEGSGITLTRASTWDTSNTSQLLRISGTAVVTVRRIYFKDGLASGMSNAAAIFNSGTLTLESCIFRGNRNILNNYKSGGAIYSASDSTLTIRGCTFYDNESAREGGAVFFNRPSTWDHNLTLTGNLFYGNISGYNYPVVYLENNSTPSISAASYNVVNVAYGTGSGQAGWTAKTGDTTFTALSITGTPFNTTTFAPVSALQSVLPSAPADFPTTDFYGNTRTFPGAPGAVR